MRRRTYQGSVAPTSTSIPRLHHFPCASARLVWRNIFMSKYSELVPLRIVFLFVILLTSPSWLLAQCVTAPSGMVDWWTADNNTFDIIGGYHGILQNGAGFDTGKVAQAFSLDGTNDYVLVPNQPAAPFNFAGSFSIDGWIFLDSAPLQFAPIVSKWNDIPLGNNHRSYFLAIDRFVL